MLQAYEFALDKVGLDFNSYQVSVLQANISMYFKKSCKKVVEVWNNKHLQRNYFPLESNFL